MDVFGQTIKRNLRTYQVPTSSFKGVSREKKPVWSNRFAKDHNDLIYDANPQSIAEKLKKSSKHKKITSNNQDEDSPARTFEYSPFKQREMAKTSNSNRNTNQGVSPFRYLKDVQEYQNKTRVGFSSVPGSSKKNNQSQQNEVAAFNEYGLGNEQQQTANIQYYNNRKSQPNLMGLSQFQYQKTVEGKISKRTNHHIDFQKNKTQKLDNKNYVWYDFSKDTNKSESLLEKQKQKQLAKLHSFKSYSAHKLYAQTKKMLESNGCGNGGLLDKFYDSANPRAYELTHQRVTKDVVNYRKMTTHPILMKKLGINLQYDTQRMNTVSRSNKKRPTFELVQTQRKLVFAREVISPRRGCFR